MIVGENEDKVSDTGLILLPGLLDRAAQRAMLDEVRAIVSRAPLFTPRMPGSNQPFSVRMTNTGSLGWVSDKSGYRYQAAHPRTALAWPAMPAAFLAIWDRLSGFSAPAECCLVNFYGAGAKMGLHRDFDEQEMAAPVVSVSLGDTAIFRVGGARRRDPTRSFRLASGDALVLGGAARHFYHGVDRVIAGSSSLLAEGGRFNLTFRRVNRAD